MDWPGEKTILKMLGMFERAACGIYAPTQIRRIGKAQAEVCRHEELLIAQATKEVAAIKDGRLQFVDGVLVATSEATQPLALPPPSVVPSDPAPASPPLMDENSILWKNAAVIHRRIANKLAGDELQKAVNLQAIMLEAQNTAADAGDSHTSDAPIEDEWFNQWREHAERVSSQTMQKLWARLLHGEAQKPGSISLLTMSALAQMGKADAELVASVAEFVLANTLWRGKQNQLFDRVPFRSLLYLEDLGLMTGLEGMGMTQIFKSTNAEKFTCTIVAGKQLLVVEGPDPAAKLQMSPVIRLTSAGQSIFGMARCALNPKYLGEVAAFIKTAGFKVGTSEIIDLGPDGTILHKLPPIDL